MEQSNLQIEEQHALYLSELFPDLAVASVFGVVLQHGLLRGLPATPRAPTQQPTSLNPAKALRSQLLANLWLTYAITPVTQADVASLLKVLVAIVEAPVELTSVTASSSLAFVQDVIFPQIPFLP